MDKVSWPLTWGVPLNYPADHPEVVAQSWLVSWAQGCLDPISWLYILLQIDAKKQQVKEAKKQVKEAKADYKSAKSDKNKK